MLEGSGVSHDPRCSRPFVFGAVCTWSTSGSGGKELLGLRSHSMRFVSERQRRRKKQSSPSLPPPTPNSPLLLLARALVQSHLPAQPLGRLSLSFHCLSLPFTVLPLSFNAFHRLSLWFCCSSLSTEKKDHKNLSDVLTARPSCPCRRSTGCRSTDRTRVLKAMKTQRTFKDGSENAAQGQGKKDSEHSRNGSENAAQAQGKAVKRQRKRKERQWRTGRHVLRFGANVPLAHRRRGVASTTKKSP